MTETALDWLAVALDEALAYDHNVASEPIALLWPDKERQWESVVRLLQLERRIISHGEFDAVRRRAPLIGCAASSHQRSH